MSDEARPSRKLWILAAVAALALHLGGAALALAHLRTDDDDDGLGAAGAEFAVEMASPKAPETDLPPGPDSEAMQEQQALPEQKAETKETELPKDQSQQVDDPDRVVTENISKKPQDEDPKIAAVETPAAEASPQSVATARQTLDEDAREAEKALAPVLGLGKDILRITTDWNRKISAHLTAHKVNPEGKQPNNQKVKVSFAINRGAMCCPSTSWSHRGMWPTMRPRSRLSASPIPSRSRPAGLTEDRFERTVDIIFTPPDERKRRRSAQRQ